MHRCNAEQAGDGSPFLVDATIAENKELVALPNRLGRLTAKIIHSRAKTLWTFCYAEKHPEGFALETRIGQFANLLQVHIGQDRLLYSDTAARFRMLIHQIRFRPDAGRERHDEFFTNRVDRRVRYLSEELLEIFEQ